MFSSFLSPKRLSQVAGTNPFLYRSYFCHVAPKIRGIICKRINKNGRRQCSCSYSTRHCSDSARTLRRSPHCSSCHRQAPRRPVNPYILSQAAFTLPGFCFFSMVPAYLCGGGRPVSPLAATPQAVHKKGRRQRSCPHPKRHCSNPSRKRRRTPHGPSSHRQARSCFVCC